LACWPHLPKAWGALAVDLWPPQPVEVEQALAAFWEESYYGLLHYESLGLGLGITPGNLALRAANVAAWRRRAAEAEKREQADACGWCGQRQASLTASGIPSCQECSSVVDRVRWACAADA